MALGRAFSVAVRGLDGEIVEIEADITGGLPGFHLVGLPDAAVQEARDRVRAAIANCGNSWPASRLTVALSPATLPKAGSLYDIAPGCRRTVGQSKEPVASARQDRAAGRTGPRRPCPGRSAACCPRCWPPSGAAGRRWWCRSAISPRPVSSTASRSSACARCVTCRAGWKPGPGSTDGWARLPPMTAPSTSLTSSGRRRPGSPSRQAAGAHHLMLTGPPGVGKTMLAQRLPGLPGPHRPEALEVTAIHSVAGLLSERTPLITRPPFIAPHHSSSVAALVGGGSGLLAGCDQPGAPRCALPRRVRGDQAERPGGAANSWKTVRFGWHGGTEWWYPARFQLVMAANPCPCTDQARTVSASLDKRRYLGSCPGPLLTVVIFASRYLD